MLMSVLNGTNVPVGVEVKASENPKNWKGVVMGRPSAVSNAALFESGPAPRKAIPLGVPVTLKLVNDPIKSVVGPTPSPATLPKMLMVFVSVLKLSVAAVA